MRLFKRGDVWYGQFYETGTRVQRSTKCTDKAAAESVAALFAWLTDELGRCDVLVNNAGVASTAPLAS